MEVFRVKRAIYIVGIILLLVPLVNAEIFYQERNKEIPLIAYIRYQQENIYWNVIDVDKYDYWVTVKQDRFGEYSGNGAIRIKGIINNKNIEINYDLLKINYVGPHQYGNWFQFDTKINVNYNNKRTHYFTTLNLVTVNTTDYCYNVFSGNQWDEFSGIIFNNCQKVE